MLGTSIDYANTKVDALIWLDSSKQNDLYEKIGSNQLDDLILKALSETTGKTVTGVVKYNGVNVGDFLDLARNQDKIVVLKDAIKAHELITFQVIKGSSTTDYQIAFRNVDNAVPTVTINGQTAITISGKTAPDDLKAQVEAYRDAAVVTLNYEYHSGSINVYEVIRDVLLRKDICCRHKYAQARVRESHS